MSILILNKKPFNEDYVEYQIVKQTGFLNSQDFWGMKFKASNGVRISIFSFPAFDPYNLDGEAGWELKLRGGEISRWNIWFRVPVEHVDDMEQAVIEVNIEHSNNKHLDREDVINECTDT